MFNGKKYRFFHVDVLLNLHAKFQRMPFNIIKPQKQRTRLFLWVFVLITLCSSIKANAQLDSANYDPIADIDSQLRRIFMPICHPDPGPWFLYDMASHSLDSIEFTDNNPDTIQRDVWFKIYEEMRNSAYNRSAFITDDSIYTLNCQFRKDTVAMNIMAYDYLRFNDSALSSNYYFTADTVNDTLIENGYPCELNPFITQRVFAASPMEFFLAYKTITFRVDPTFIFHDSYNDFMANNWTIQIDFGDGSGWHTITNPTMVSHFTITYPTKGLKVIRTRVLDGPSTVIMTSNSMVQASDRVKPTPQRKIFIGDASVSVWEPCSESGGPLQKTIFYLEGLDVQDASPFHDRDEEQIYLEMVEDAKIPELLNFGYQIAVVNWDNSRRDIKDNAQTLIDILKYFKCEQVTLGDSGTHQQFVIIAESMGGLVARYALCDFEQNWSTIGGCLAEKMHNTRLLITFDSPHKGANIPIAYQHLYRNVTRLIFGANTISQRQQAVLNKAMLDAKSVKQMLLYHVDSYNPITQEYSQHNDKGDFDDDLLNIGNYPQYCKLVAMSNGSLKGIGQTHFYDTLQRTPNDYLMDWDINMWVTLFGETAILAGTNFELRTTPNGNGTIHTSNYDFYKPKVKITIKKWKLKVVVTSSYWYSVGGSYYGKNVKPYDVIPGSLYDVNSMAIDEGWEASGLIRTLVFGLNKPHYDTTTHVWSLSHWTGGKRFAFGRDVRFTTDGLHFCFIPTFSALNYDITDWWENIEDETMSTKMSKTPFDLITGITERYPYLHINNQPPLSLTGNFIAYNVKKYNREHLQIRNDSLGDWVNGVSGNKPIWRYPNCNETQGHRKYWLNQEIGDDTLRIENRETAWMCLYDAERYIAVNERSPFYRYVSTTPATFIIPGMYSKENDLTIASGKLLILMTRDTNNIHVPTSYSRTEYVKDSIPWVRCCFFGAKSTLPENPELEKIESENAEFIVYPNPISNNEITIRYTAVPDPNSRLVIYNISGSRMIDKSFDENNNGITTYKLEIEQGKYPSGLYYITLKNGDKLYKQSIIIK